MREASFQVDNPISWSVMKVAQVSVKSLHPMHKEKLPSDKVRVIIACGPQDHEPNDATKHQNPPRVKVKMRWGQLEVVQNFSDRAAKPSESTTPWRATRISKSVESSTQKEDFNDLRSVEETIEAQ